MGIVECTVSTDLAKKIDPENIKIRKIYVCTM